MRRWVCSRCDGGVLAPAKPDPDDARRYCLDCTHATGRLVRRTCPAADRVRAARREAGREKRTRNAALVQERERVRFTVAGIDVREALDRCWTALAPAWRAAEAARLLLGERPILTGAVLPVTVRAGVRPKPSVSVLRRGRGPLGVVISGYLVTVCVGAPPAPAEVWSLLLRSAAKVALGGAPQLRDCYDAVRRAARRLWKLRLPARGDVAHLLTVRLPSLLAAHLAANLSARGQGPVHG